MKIGIVGHGYVGSAVATSHSKDQLYIRDPKLENSATIEELGQCLAVYICVPSPSTVDGYCDTSILESTLEEINLPEHMLIISKVTAPPLVYERLQKKYPKLVHVPEFLTAANNIEDYQNADFFVVGGEIGSCLGAIYVVNYNINLPLKNFLVTDIKTAALYKYMMNSYLAAKVTFMNQYKQIAESMNIDFNELTRLSGLDKRIGSTHMAVPGPDGQYGWGGGCFPKDIAAIINEAKDLGVDVDLLKSVVTINDKQRSFKND